MIAEIVAATNDLKMIDQINFGLKIFRGKVHGTFSSSTSEVASKRVELFTFRQKLHW